MAETDAGAETLPARFARRLGDVDPARPERVPEVVDAILSAARECGASDIHLVPRSGGLDMSWRVEGMLYPVATFPPAVRPNIVSRLKVLGDLLTYQTETPQEGRLHTTPGQVEMRVSIFPTLHGEKAVVRIFGTAGGFRDLDSLNYAPELTQTLQHSLHETSGIVLISGPAGSGKTTTAYACLREIAERFAGAKSLATLEDPIEAEIAGAAQSQIAPLRGFDYATALKSLLRQDPEVILVGEIRDAETAALTFQAALTGHLVLTTFHAGSAAETVSRLLDMGIEPYQLRSGLLCVVNQRLIRVLCECAEERSETEGALGLDVDAYRVPRGCERCAGTGYAGRVPLAEVLTLADPQIGAAVLAREDSATIESAALAAGMVGRWQRAREAVRTGVTSPQEVRRVLGFRGPRS